MGDAAVDIPDANVLIQSSQHSKSKNQEIQRIGRIQRKDDKEQHIAYTLVTLGTEEEANVRVRREHAFCEGYSTKIMTEKDTHMLKGLSFDCVDKIELLDVIKDEQRKQSSVESDSTKKPLSAQASLRKKMRLK